MKIARTPSVLALLLIAAVARAELPPIKPAPSRPPDGPSVVVEDFEVLPDCAADRVCGEGLIRNVGSKTAYNVRLRVEIGGTKYGKPRTFFFRDIDKTEMEPTEAQSFAVSIERRHPYKDAKGEDKIIEVGRYNFKIVPVWTDTPRPPPKPVPAKKPKKG